MDIKKQHTRNKSSMLNYEDIPLDSTESSSYMSIDDDKVVKKKKWNYLFHT